jgi:hypothetical protein
MTPIFLLAYGGCMREGAPFVVLAERDVFRYGFLLLCVPCEFETESLGQVASAFVGCEVMDRTPKVQYVAGCSAGRVETLEDVLVQVNREGPSSSALGCMNWTGATTLRSVASQTIEVAQVTQYLLHGDLATNVRKVN